MCTLGLEEYNSYFSLIFKTNVAKVIASINDSNTDIQSVVYTFVYNLELMF